jgi:hypothetical protein
MSWTTIKRTANDIAFSLLIREMAGWRCEKCNKLCRVQGVWIAQLDASHYIGRAKKSTRFDIQNVYSLCNPCHSRMGDYKREEDGEYDLWVKEILGEREYRLLVIRANTPNPMMADKKIVKMYIAQLKKDYVEGKLSRTIKN